MGNTNDLGGVSGGYDSDTQKYFTQKEGGTSFDVKNYSKEMYDPNADPATSLSTRSNSLEKEPQKVVTNEEGTFICETDECWERWHEVQNMAAMD